MHKYTLNSAKHDDMLIYTGSLRTGFKGFQGDGTSFTKSRHDNHMLGLAGA